MSGGYGDDNIVARVTCAARSVLSGSARYERDSVPFNDTNYPFAVLAALLRAASLNLNRLEVIDFGGSLAALTTSAGHFSTVFRPSTGASWNSRNLSTWATRVQQRGVDVCARP